MNIGKRCNKFSCNELIGIKETYCDKHKNDNYKQYEKARTSTNEGKEYKYFYSRKAWKDKRYQTLLRDGFICLKCGREAEMVDHIIPTKVRWDLRLEMDNLQSLCNECHSKKTMEDKKIHY